jgi:hypothetical protein
MMDFTYFKQLKKLEKENEKLKEVEKLFKNLVKEMKESE